MVRLTLARDLVVALVMAAMCGWALTQLGPNSLLVLAFVGSLVALVLTLIIRHSERRVGLPSVPKAATESELRGTLGKLLSSGTAIRAQIETSTVRTDPIRETFSKMELADLTYKWVQLAERVIGGVLGQSYVDQFRTRVRDKPRLARPDMAPELADYWDSLEWRLEWLNDRMDRMVT